MLLFPLYVFSIYLHLTLGSIFVYKILYKHWKLEKFQALFGALIWTFIGFNSEWLSAGQVLITASYLPICFYFSLNLIENKTRRNFILYYVSIALSFLAGYTMVAVLILAICTLYKFLILPKFGAKEILNFIKSEIRGILLITFPIILPVYINPFVSFFYSIRSILNIESFLAYSTHITDLVESIFPRNTLFNSENKTNTVYLFFSLVGLILLNESGTKIKSFLNKRNLIIVLFGILSLLISLGKATPLSTLLFYILPGFNFFRRISIFSLIAGFSFCLILPQFINKRYERKNLKIVRLLIIFFYVVYIRVTIDRGNFGNRAILESLLIFLLIMSLTYISILVSSKNTKLMRIGLIMVLLVESWLNSSSKLFNNSKINPALIFRPNRIIKKIKSEIKPMERVELLPTQYNYTTDYLDLEQTVGYISLASIYGVRINGMLNTPGIDPNNLMDVIGVKYLVVKGNADLKNSERIYSVTQSANEPDFFSYNYKTYEWDIAPPNTVYSIYKRRTALPRTYLASNVVPAKQEERLLQKIAGNKQAKTVYLDKNDIKTYNVTDIGTADVVEYKRNYIKVKTNTPASSFLANSTAYYPGWFIRVNGKWHFPTRANWFMMGTFLNEGINVVEFIYFPYGLIIGSMYSLSVLTYLLIKRKI